MYFQSSCVLIGFLWAPLHHSQAHTHTDECGTHEPTFSFQRFFDEEREERQVFGDSVSNLSPLKLGAIFQRFFKISQGRERSLAESDEAVGAYYQLKDIPVAFHVLPQHDNGGTGKPSLTMLQAEYAIAATNKLFTIYNKEMAVSESFASFQLDRITLHDVAFDGIMDCSEIPRTTLGRLIMGSADFEFKLHVIVCESNKFSGRASFPYQYSPHNPMHNTMLMDYRSFACWDDLNNFLCDATNSSDGSQTSHTRWWRSRSAMVAHETGHLFGLQHTFSTDCWISQLFGGDRVSDTPYHTTSVSKSCPGLLPYDRDRDSLNKRPNPVTTSTRQCDVACSGHCGACCDVDGDGVCPKYQADNDLEIVSEDAFSFPKCCSDPRPIDSCPWSVGVDPLNNVMSYVPDECAQEFTIGQMARMMVQIRQYKHIIYCNYSTLKEDSFCDSVPCSDWATGPNCL